MTPTVTIVKADLYERALDDEDRGRKPPRLYFGIEDYNVFDNLMNRGSEPHQLVHPLIPQLLADHEVSGYAGHARWNNRAGCDDCPCSPGFMLYGVQHPVLGKEFDIHVQISVVEPVDLGAGI